MGAIRTWESTFLLWNDTKRAGEGNGDDPNCPWRYATEEYCIAAEPGSMADEHSVKAKKGMGKSKISGCKQKSTFGGARCVVGATGRLGEDTFSALERYQNG